MAEISEPDLRLPMLALLAEHDAGLTTTELIALLTARLRPTGHDAETIGGRRDTFFSQKVRNLTGSHRGLERAGYVVSGGSRKAIRITAAGLAYLEFARTNGTWRGFENDLPKVTQAGRRAEAALSGSDWSDAEVDNAINAYFGMLRLELDGEPFVKRQVVNATMEQLPGRTRGALEFKFENISAVLNQLELSWLAGYVPAGNYQQRLVDAVLAVLMADDELAKRIRAADEAVPPPPPVVLATRDVLVDPPVPTGAAARASGASHVVPGGWIASHDESNKKLGADGETWVVALERENLRRAGRPDLADRVDHVASRLGDGLGFDVLSFDVEGNEIHIEVKTTRSGLGTPFVLTRNEIRTSKDDPASYRLYRVFDFGLHARLYILEGDLEGLLELTPTQFSARMKPHA